MVLVWRRIYCCQASQGLTAKDDSATQCSHRCDGRPKPFHCLRIDQRAHQRSGFERIANLDLPVGGNKPAHQFVVARFVHHQTPRGGAALAGGSHRAKQQGGNGEVQIRRVVDDEGVVARAFSSNEQPRN